MNGVVSLPLLAAAEPQQPSRFLHRTTPTSPLKTRVWGFCQSPSGRFPSRRRQSRGIATGSGRCAERTVAGRRQWPNRDPYDEAGFQAVRRQSGGGRNSPTGSLYVFVENNSVGSVDPWGLTKFRGCSPARQRQIEDGLKDRLKKAQDGGCFKCLSGRGQKWIDQFAAGQLTGTEEVTIVCDDQTSKNCYMKDSTGTEQFAAGQSVPNSRVSHICVPPDDNQNPNDEIGCTALHEISHSLGGVGDDKGTPGSKGYDGRAYDIENCAGCPGHP